MIGTSEFAKALPYAEQCAVIADAQRGDAAAMRRAIATNMRLVAKLAIRFSDRLGCPELQEELVQAAVCESGGLVRAIQRFDPTGGRKFSPFAARWIWGAFVRVWRRSAAIEDNLSWEEIGDLEISDGWGEDDAIAAIDDDNAAGDLREALAELPLRERGVISRKYGIGGRVETTAEIARSLGVSTETIRKIERVGLDALRDILG